MKPDVFASAEEFGHSLLDVEVWRPYVEAICLRHGIEPRSMSVPPGDRSNPVVLVDDKLFVKLHAPYSNFEDTIGLEPAALRALQQSAFPAPRLVAEGQLAPGEGWPWPYWITRKVDGKNLEEPWESMSIEARSEVTHRFGTLVSRLHGLKSTQELELVWRHRFPGGFAGFLEKRRRWLQSVDHPAYSHVASIDLKALAGEREAIVHGDLEPAHLFLGAELSIIDFGDVKLGDPLYDLVTVKTMLAPWPALFDTFLEGYGLRITAEGEGRLRAYQILHEWGPRTD